VLVRTCGVLASIVVCHSCRTRVEQLLEWCGQNTEYAVYAPLFLLCYVFLLRLPSEALPVRLGSDGLQLVGSELILHLARRCAGRGKPWVCPLCPSFVSGKTSRRVAGSCAGAGVSNRGPPVRFMRWVTTSRMELWAVVPSGQSLQPQP